MELPLAGTSTILSFFPDDTIETVQQHVALALKTHPDRLFIQVQVELPATYYSTNPKRWMDLFFRLSYGKNTITKEALDIYVTHIRKGTSVLPRNVSREEWENVDPYLIPIFDPQSSFKEWRILGVPEDKSVVLPIPVKDIDLPEAYRPIPRRQALFETVHREEAHEIMAVEVDPVVSTDRMKQVYFPLFQGTTPNNIESLRSPLKASHDQIERLISLKAPKPSNVSILRAKWYIPLVSTRFSAPRTRFEQIFYGLTVSPDTPVISYFTSRTETLRHKFYVADPKAKKPVVDIPTWKAWMSNTQPQRRLPTLLLYRGKNRSSFDRIAITSKDITVSTWRGKESSESLEDLKKSTFDWIRSLDAVIPFMVDSDLETDRWELNDLSVIASYSSEISEFDLRRLTCLKDVFSFQDDTFRLIRADRDFDVPAQVLRAYSLLQNGETDLQTALGVSPEEASALTTRVQELEADEHFNFEKASSGYPTVTFSAKEVIIKFVSNLERVVDYASMLRYVLTSDKAEVNAVCPRQMETVEATAAVVPTTLAVENEFVLDDFLMNEIEEVSKPTVAEPVQVKETKVKVKKGGPAGTHSYFNTRVHEFDPEMFDAEYPKKCEKLKQVVVLTEEDQARIPGTYNYADAPAEEKIQLEGGIAICPQYWCIRDEIPLSEAQLVVKEDGQHCPMCDGKVRLTEKEDVREFTVIKREQAFKFPGWKEPSAKTMSKKRVPCCYKRPETNQSVVLKEKENLQIDDYYVLSSGTLPGLRIAYLPEDLTRRLNIKTDYAKNVPNNRIDGSASDMFRVGMGQPRVTLPILLNDKRSIPSPENAKDDIIQCSFFHSWKDLGDGNTEIERITAGIDRAWKNKTLKPIEEIEYVTRILDCRVIRINMETQTILCGFWSEKTSPNSRTIALLDTDVLAKVTRRTGKVGSKFDYVVDINKFADSTKRTLQKLHVQACASDAPTFESALAELMAKNMSQYQVILDPFKRVQALFVPQEVVLPIQPVGMDIPMGVSVRSGYSDVKDEELPTGAIQAEFMKGAKHSGFKWVSNLYSVDGNLTEFLLESGFRAPVRPEKATTTDPAKEVISTIRPPHSEEELVSAPPNQADMNLAREIAYSSEVFEFLMFSLSQDVQLDDYEALRKSIANPKETLYRDLSKWLTAKAYWDTVSEPVQFVNKVRTPCGQMLKDTCKKSTLCGWHKGSCKIKVKPMVDKAKILIRLTKALKENTKQRALVLDGRLSPFFSTVLYLEMPHELIVTSI
jgi:hypothetical protein